MMEIEKKEENNRTYIKKSLYKSQFPKYPKTYFILAIMVEILKMIMHTSQSSTQLHK